MAERSYPELAKPLAPHLMIVLIIASRSQQVSRHVIRDCATQRVPAGAAASEVDAAKDARIGDFGYRLGKTRVGTSSAGKDFGGDTESGVLSKEVSKHERGSPTEAGMRRRIFGMRRRAGE